MEGPFKLPCLAHNYTDQRVSCLSYINWYMQNECDFFTSHDIVYSSRWCEKMILESSLSHILYLCQLMDHYLALHCLHLGLVHLMPICTIKWTITIKHNINTACITISIGLILATCTQCILCTPILYTACLTALQSLAMGYAESKWIFHTLWQVHDIRRLQQ